MWKYEGNVTANILQNVPTGFAINGAILLAALQLCLSSALGHSALFQHLEDKFQIERCEYIFNIKEFCKKEKIIIYIYYIQ